MLIGPIDSRMLVGNSAQVNQGKKFSDTPVDFETMLRNSRIQMLENLINPNRSFSCESAQNNPLASHQWEVVTKQLTRLGTVYKEYGIREDQMHQSESDILFFHLCLADPKGPGRGAGAAVCLTPLL